MTHLAHPTFEPKRKADEIEALNEVVAQRDKTIKALGHRIDTLEELLQASQAHVISRYQWRALK